MDTRVVDLEARLARARLNLAALRKDKDALGHGSYPKGHRFPAEGGLEYSRYRVGRLGGHRFTPPTHTSIVGGLSNVQLADLFHRFDLSRHLRAGRATLHERKMATVREFIAANPKFKGRDVSLYNRLPAEESFP